MDVSADAETVLGRYLRETGLSRRRLARCSDLPEKTISRLASGKVRAPRERVARAIAAASRWLTPQCPLTYEELLARDVDPSAAASDVTAAIDSRDRDNGTITLTGGGM